MIVRRIATAQTLQRFVSNVRHFPYERLETHSPPVANSNSREIFCLVAICRDRTTGTGSARVQKSITMLAMLSTMYSVSLSTHVGSTMDRSQLASTGEQPKMLRKKYATE